MKKIRGMYFSGTGTTEKTVCAVADGLYAALCADAEESICRAENIDFTAKEAREKSYSFNQDDIVVFGVPVIAGRVPNVLLNFLDTLEGGGAAALPLVLYGNRNFDDALIELRNILESRGFHTAAAGAFVGEHSFSRRLAAGRPDEADMIVAADFAKDSAHKLIKLMKEGDLSERLAAAGPVDVDGEEPYRPYYKPRDRQGSFINILKVKPKLNEKKCDGCGICVRACPMGSIKPEAPGIVDGICIKCCSCEKKCPKGALYFDDPGYLYHKEELELGYALRREPRLFL